MPFAVLSIMFLQWPEHETKTTGAPPDLRVRSPSMAKTDKQDSLDIRSGYREVDAQPDLKAMVASMDATATWPAVRQLRAWERRQLALVPGERLLDVGCGPGDVAIELAADVSPEVVLGVDASAAMVAEGRARAAAAGVPVEFRVADALALSVDTGVMDACRSERMLQWVPDVDRAAAELVRVLRPGGRLVVTDTDWRSLAIDVLDSALVGPVLLAMERTRGPGYRVGGQLLNKFRDLGLVDVACAAATHVWSTWDPDSDPMVSGLFPFRSAILQLADLGMLEANIAARFVTDIEEIARRDRLFISLTMFAVYGRKPDHPGSAIGAT